MTAYTIERNSCFVLSQGLNKNIGLLNIKGLLLYFLNPLLFLIIMPVTIIVDLYAFASVKRIFYNQCGNDVLNLDFFKNGTIKDLRDRYIDLCKQIQKRPIMNLFMGRLFKNALFRWDDLMDDIAIASDDEFKNIIAQIVNKVA